MLLKVLRPRQYERSSVAMYLGLGWIGLPALGMLISVASSTVLAFLGLGVLFYSAGVVFHLRKRLRYHNAIWHSFVLVAAGCHYVAIMALLRDTVD